MFSLTQPKIIFGYHWIFFRSLGPLWIFFFLYKWSVWYQKKGKKDAWNSFREVSPPPCPYGTEMKSVVLRGLIIIGKKSKNNLIYILKLNTNCVKSIKAEIPIKCYSKKIYIFNISRLFQYIGGYKNVYIAPTLCFMLLDGAAIFWETTDLSWIVEKLKSWSA